MSEQPIRKMNIRKNQNEEELKKKKKKRDTEEIRGKIEVGPNVKFSCPPRSERVAKALVEDIFLFITRTYLHTQFVLQYLDTLFVPTVRR